MAVLQGNKIQKALGQLHDCTQYIPMIRMFHLALAHRNEKLQKHKHQRSVRSLSSKIRERRTSHMKICFGEIFQRWSFAVRQAPQLEKHVAPVKSIYNVSGIIFRIKVGQVSKKDQNRGCHLSSHPMLHDVEHVSFVQVCWKRIAEWNLAQWWRRQRVPRNRCPNLTLTVSSPK